MKSSNVFIITDLPKEGENRCTLVIGPKDHETALNVYKSKFPERQPIAVVSKNDLETTLRNVDKAVKDGTSTLFEIVKSC